MCLHEQIGWQTAAEKRSQPIHRNGRASQPQQGPAGFARLTTVQGAPKPLQDHGPVQAKVQRRQHKGPIRTRHVQQARK